MKSVVPVTFALLAKTADHCEAPVFGIAQSAAAKGHAAHPRKVANIYQPPNCTINVKRGGAYLVLRQPRIGRYYERGSSGKWRDRGHQSGTGSQLYVRSRHDGPRRPRLGCDVDGYGSSPFGRPSEIKAATRCAFAIASSMSFAVPSLIPKATARRRNKNTLPDAIAPVLYICRRALDCTRLTTYDAALRSPRRAFKASNTSSPPACTLHETGCLRSSPTHKLPPRH